MRAGGRHARGGGAIEGLAITAGNRRSAREGPPLHLKNTELGKNERDNITEQERAALLDIGDEYMRLEADKLDELVAKGTLIEAACE